MKYDKFKVFEVDGIMYDKVFWNGAMVVFFCLQFIIVMIKYIFKRLGRLQFVWYVRRISVWVVFSSRCEFEEEREEVK